MIILETVKQYVKNVALFFEPYSGLILALIIITMILFFATLILGPFVIGRLRQDFFLDDPEEEPVRRSLPLRILKAAGLVVKNLLGLVLLAAGIAMLFTPGQGLLTIIMGLCLINFPGKRKLLKKLTSTDKVRRGLNWIRRKLKKPPFLFNSPGV